MVALSTVWIVCSLNVGASESNEGLVFVCLYTKKVSLYLSYEQTGLSLYSSKDQTRLSLYSSKDQTRLSLYLSIQRPNQAPSLLIQRQHQTQSLPIQRQNQAQSLLIQRLIPSDSQVFLCLLNNLSSEHFSYHNQTMDQFQTDPHLLW